MNVAKYIRIISPKQKYCSVCSIGEKSILIFERDKNLLCFETSKDFKALVLNGKPIDEPVVSYGPFVMNTKQEILTAINDYQNGSMANIT